MRPHTARRAPLVPFALLLGLGGLVPCAQADGRDAVRLEALVPASTHALLGVHDLGPGLARRLGETGLGRLAREPEMAAYLADLAAKTRRVLDATERGAVEGTLSGIGPFQAGVLRLLEALEGEAAFAWISTREDGTPVLAGVVDFGPHLGDLLSFLSRCADRKPETGRPIVELSSSGGPLHFRVGGLAPERVHGVVVGTAVFLSNDEAWVAARSGEGAAVAAEVRNAPTLADTPAWLDLQREGAFEGAVVFGFLAVPPRETPWSADVRPDWLRTALTILGVGAPGVITYTARVSGGGVEERLSSQDSGRGLLSLFAGTRDLRPVALVPHEEVIVAFAGRFRTTELLPCTRGVLTALGLDADEVFDSTLGWVVSRLHVDPVREVLRGLTGEISIGVAMPRTGGLYPEVVAVFGLVDPPAFEALLVRATERLCEELSVDGDVEWTSRALPFHGTNLHVLEGAEVGGGERVPGLPTWAILGDRLWLAPVPHVLKEVVLAADEAKRAAPGAVPLARARLGRPPRPVAVPGAGASLLLDCGAIEAVLYDTGVPVMQSFLGPALKRCPVHPDSALLPATRVVVPHLVGQSVSLSSEVDRRGTTTARIEARGAVPLLGGLIVAGALAALAPDAAAPPESEGPVGDPLASVSTDDPKVETHRILLRVAAAIEEFTALQGVLPSSLADLVTPAYLLGTLPPDRWGRALRWRPDDTGRRGVLASSGPDGLPDTSDDVTVEVEPFGK